MHILFVWSYWHYPGANVEFLEKVRAEGYKVSVLMGDFDGKHDLRRLKGDIDFYFPPKWDALSKFTRTPYPVFKNIADCLKTVHPDVVHINSHLFLSNYQAAWAACSMKIPFVVTVHGIIGKRSLVLDMLQKLYLRTVAKSMFNMASSVICLTENDAAVTARITGGNRKVSIVPNGVDTRIFKPSAERTSDSIFWAGRLVPEKGLVYLLKAMVEVVKARPNAHLVLAGVGILQDELVGLSDRLGLCDHVSFIGMVSREEVARIMSKANVFVIPSLVEGMPLALLEAMSSGNAVVASDIGGIRGIVKDHYNGLLVPPHNVEELASSILELLRDDGLRKRLAENARETVAKNHSWSNVLTRLIPIYKSAKV